MNKSFRRLTASLMSAILIAASMGLGLSNAQNVNADNSAIKTENVTESGLKYEGELNDVNSSTNGNSSGDMATDSSAQAGGASNQSDEPQLKEVPVVNDSIDKGASSYDFEAVAKNPEQNMKTADGILKIAGEDRDETAALISRQGWRSGSDTVIIVNGFNTLEGIIASPLAGAYNAPVLTVKSNRLPNVTRNELVRLKPRTIIMVGDKSSISKSVSNAMRAATGAHMLRAARGNVSDTSVRIAELIRQKVGKVDEVYVVSGTNGPADALSIAARSAQRRMPVIVVNKNNVPSEAYRWIKNVYPAVAYIIGGENSISEKTADTVRGLVANSKESVRISGVDRHDTNAKVLSKFYKREQQNIFVAKSKSSMLVDAVALGPFAAQSGSPVIITPTDSISPYYNQVLKEFKTVDLYQIGGGISASVMNKLREDLNTSDFDGKDPNPNYVPERPAIKPPVAEPKDEKPANQKPQPKPQPKPANKPDKKPEVVIPDNTPRKTNLNRKLIVLDPGHGGKDSGAVGSGTMEKILTIKTANYCASYLRAHGYEVIMTRTSDVYSTPSSRPERTNKYNAAYFVSIHYNDSSNKSAGGAEVFYQVQDKNGGLSKTCASNILKNILSSFNLTNRGIKLRYWPGSDKTNFLAVLRGSSSPAVLVEGGFVSNPNDMGQINNEAGLKKMGEAIAKGIIQSLN